MAKAQADAQGFILILPDNPGQNCWDVGAAMSLKHDGGGDTQAVAPMIKYTITKYNADPGRVYIMGGSGGAMLVQAMLAVYPDLIRAGVARAGVAAGCWADGYATSNQWSNNCAGGNTIKTAQQWGDLVRAMYPGYTGHRPRLMTHQGDADTTISYKNTGEAIKEWTNVLGLSMTPTSTDTGTRPDRDLQPPVLEELVRPDGLRSLDITRRHALDGVRGSRHAQVLRPQREGVAHPETDCGSTGTGGAGGDRRDGRRRGWRTGAGARGAAAAGASRWWHGHRQRGAPRPVGTTGAGGTAERGRRAAAGTTGGAGATGAAGTGAPVGTVAQCGWQRQRWNRAAATAAAELASGGAPAGSGGVQGGGGSTSTRRKLPDRHRRHRRGDSSSGGWVRDRQRPAESAPAPLRWRRCCSPSSSCSSVADVRVADGSRSTAGRPAFVHPGGRRSMAAAPRRAASPCHLTEGSTARHPGAMQVKASGVPRWRWLLGAVASKRAR